MRIRNNWLRKILLLGMVLAALSVAAFAANSPEAFYTELEQNLRAHQTQFQIAYTADAVAAGLLSDGEPSLALLLRQMAAQSPDTADNADYPSLNVADGTVEAENGVFHFTVEYLATPDELAEVSRRAQEIVDSFDLEKEDDYTKIKLLYEYIGTHYVYDDTLTKFSAYDGLTTGSMVCQGYALLTYRVMWDAGIPCRIITGISSSQNHAWNIVKLNGSWYNLDSTWDAAPTIGGEMTWHYFLKNQAEFVGHTRFLPYQTPAFEAAHPMSRESATLPQITVEVNGAAVSNLIVRNGVSIQLSAKLPDAVQGAQIQWVSADPSLVSVSADGMLQSTKPGTTLVTVQITGNRGVITAHLPVQAVDLTTASDWAFDSVTDFYLHQLLPGTLCSDFQQGITRAELARLLNQFVIKTTDFGGFYIENQYVDLDECPDVIAILNCKSAGLMDGTSVQYFRPDDIVTREQAAKVIVRLMEYLEDVESNGNGSIAAYADADAISDWAAPFVATATRMGLLQGNNGSFLPQQQMTREQMIVALERVYASWAAQQPIKEAA